MQTERPITDSVSKERWLEAQTWEQNHWVRAQQSRARFGKNLIWRLLLAIKAVPKYRGDDRNFWWKKHFDDYSFLPSSVENAIEVGCGPYTNVRLMVPHCRFSHLVLSDPLIRTYVGFKLTFVSEMYRQAACMLDDHPLEELPFRANYFELVVMINVLDHVQNAGRCLQNVIDILKPGGLLILGQDLTNEEDLKVLQRDPGLPGHPIKLDEHWFEPFLSRFEPRLKKVLSRDQSYEPHQHYGALIFAGRKASNT
jgi:SAM-dependent methyltransferase